MGHERDDIRAAWRENRRRMETALAVQRLRHSRQGIKAGMPLDAATKVAASVLVGLGLYGAVSRHAARFVIERHTLVFPDLPPHFHGYTILHLSDLHVAAVPGLMAEAGRRLAAERIDLVVLTGDYQTHGAPAAGAVAVEMAGLLTPLTPVDGAVAVLGNHDGHTMVDALEGLGIRVLVNEAITVGRHDDMMHLVGTDDIHAFHTPAAAAVLARPVAGFSIALVHTPELADIAAAAGHRLYLCGHTHGGQVCLPGGVPLLTALDSHRELASGHWRRGAMQGYTSRGLGSARPPLRINCAAEAAVIRLERNPGFP
jgi:predicted MPP superfamily phosphohydrolase